MKEIQPGRLGLEGSELKWMNEKWRLIRRAQALADASTNDWQRINDEIKTYLDASGVGDVVQRARIKGESLALKDALGAGAWHAANAQRHIDDVALFLRMKEWELL